jgi:hypothetical protein
MAPYLATWLAAEQVDVVQMEERDGCQQEAG